MTGQDGSRERGVVGPLSTRRLVALAVVSIGLAGNLLSAVPVPATAAATPAAAAAVDPGDRIIQTVAGTGKAGYGGDAGAATGAQVNSPQGLASDSAGNFYIADLGNNRVRKVDPSGTITVVAGTGNPEHSGDGSAATAAGLSPSDVTLDAAGNLYIADALNHRIRKVDTTGTITTLAGTSDGLAGDAGPAVAAQLSGPQSVRVDVSGDVYIADTNNHRIRKVDTSGTITTFSGTSQGYAGDSGPAAAAQLDAPTGLSLDGGNVYIADTKNHLIRKVDPTGIITTVAGTWRLRDSSLRRPLGRDPRDADDNVRLLVTRAEEVADGVEGTHPLLSDEDFGGDGGPATAAQLAFPHAVTVAGGVIYVADTVNERVRKVDASGTITTFAGSNSACGFGGDGRSAAAARLCRPAGIAVDGVGNVLVSDTANHRVRAMGVLSLGSTATPDPAPMGGLVTYTLRAANDSAVPATGVTITDTLPTNSTFHSVDTSQGSCSQGAGTVSCQLGDLAAETVATIDVSVTAPNELTTVSNYATMAATHPDTVVGDDSVTQQVEVVAPRLHLTQTDTPDPTTAGQPLTYTLTATNALSSPATDVTVTDSLAPEVSFGSATSTQGSCSEAGHIVTCAVGTLDYAASVTVTIVVTPDVGGLITNTATVRAAEFPQGTESVATTFVSGVNCGTVLTTDTVLTSDVGPCLGTGLIAGADLITIDLGGHRVFGFPGPSNGLQSGIRLSDRTRVTVKNGTVSDFDAGVFISGGDGSHVVTGMTLRDNLGPDTSASYLGDGIYVENSPGAQLLGNTIVNNGIFDGIGIYGVRSAEATVDSNIVEDSKGPTDSGLYGQGIIVNAFVDIPDRGRTVPGMRFLNNVVRRSDSAGISNFNHTDGTIVGNIVEGNGLRNVNGNGIAIQLGPGAPPGTRLLVQGNEVHGNRWNGIEAGFLATGNQIIDNDASNNNISRRTSSFDLADLNPECAGNVWSGNTWGSGGFSPACTTTGGTQAPITNRPVADFDGGGDTDFSVFRPSNGVSYVQGGTDVAWGTAGDIAVPADYIGDARTDVAVFRPSSGTWFVKDGPTLAWGTTGDIPLPGDYDGDAKADIAVFRPDTGTWFVHPSGGGPDTATNWGTAGDVAVPGDYDGNGTTDIAVFRPSTGTWFVQGGATTNWGTNGDIPVPGDYDGNGTTDIAVFRPSTGTWFVNGGATTNWGTAGDIPVPGDYDANATNEIAVFRPSTGTWFVNGGATTNWGTAGDQPLPLPAAIRQTLAP